MLHMNKEQLCSFPEVIAAEQNKRAGYPDCACTQTPSLMSDLRGILIHKLRTDKSIHGVKEEKGKLVFGCIKKKKTIIMKCVSIELHLHSVNLFS